MSAMIVRLQSGEELVAKVEEGMGTITLTDITIILPTQQGSIQLAPFMPYADLSAGLTLSEDKILFKTAPHKDLGDYYAELFKEESMILTPNKKILV